MDLDTTTPAGQPIVSREKACFSERIYMHNTYVAFFLDRTISYPHFREDWEFPPTFSFRRRNAAHY